MKAENIYLPLAMPTEFSGTSPVREFRNSRSPCFPVRKSRVWIFFVEMRIVASYIEIEHLACDPDLGCPTSRALRDVGDLTASICHF